MVELDGSVVARLGGERVGWLSTLRPDGSPHLTPVWFVYLLGSLWVGTSANTVKVRNVSGDPRVSFALQDGNAPVVAEGTVAVLRSRSPAEVVGALLSKYGWEFGAVAQGPAPVLLRITVGRWLMTGTAR